MEFPKKGCQLHHDDLKQRSEDINIVDRPLREAQPRREDPLEYRNQTFPPYSPLKSRDEISCRGGEL